MHADTNVIQNYYFPGVFFIVLGALAILKRSFWAKMAIKWNIKIVGYAGRKKTYEYFLLFGGIAFIILGVLVLTDVIHFRE